MLNKKRLWIVEKAECLNDDMNKDFKTYIYY